MARRSAATPRLAPEVRREQLLDAALDVITDDGFSAVSVEAVARRAGITRPVIYDHFGDLDSLLVALFEREEQAALTSLLDIVGEEVGDDVDPEAFLVDAVQAFLDAVRRAPQTWRLIVMPPRGESAGLRKRIRASRRMVVERVVALLDWGTARRGGPLGLDHELFARLIVSAGEDAARLMLAHPRRYGPQRLASIAREGLKLLPTQGTSEVRARPGAPVPPPSPRERLSPPPASKRMPQRERREQVLDVTLELLVEGGFEALTVEAIARRAGVSRLVVYRSFADLSTLLLALLAREERRTRTTLDALLPADPAGRSPAVLLDEALAAFLGAVVRDPWTWRLALLRPEHAPAALQKLVNRRRSALAEQLQPMVRWGLAGIAAPTDGLDVDVLTRMLLSVGEEIARLALDDPEFPPERLLESTWGLLRHVP